MIINIILFFLLFLLIGLTITYLLKQYKPYKNDYEEARTVFVKYLKEKDDVETLKVLGEINPFGAYERWNVNLLSLSNSLEQIACIKKDREYDRFLEHCWDYISIKKKYVLSSGILAQIGFSILYILMENLF